MVSVADTISDMKPVPADLMRSYRSKLEGELDFVGKSRHMKQIFEQISEYASIKKPVSVAGNKGTGRKIIAQAIHLESSDWWKPFYEIDLTGMSIEDASKILFGFEESHIFSSQVKKEGYLTLAFGSTLCLKNFDRYSKDVQSLICNASFSKKFNVVGSGEEKPFECRLIFTIQQSPESLKKIEIIDESLCELIGDRVVTIPSLSKRKDDIIPLANKFVRDCCSDFEMPLKKISKDAERWLKKAPWLQNVIQLKKSIFRACINTKDSVLYPHHFALAHEGNLERYQEKQLEELSISDIVEQKLESFLGRLGSFEANHLHEAIMDRVEEPLIKLVLGHVGGNQIKASRMLGINRNTLRAKIKKYNVRILKDGRVK